MLEAAVSYRRNKDDYAFDRLRAGRSGPSVPTPPLWLTGCGGIGPRAHWAKPLWFTGVKPRRTRLRSTSLTFQKSRTRTLGKASLARQRKRLGVAAGRSGGCGPGRQCGERFQVRNGSSMVADRGIGARVAGLRAARELRCGFCRGEPGCPDLHGAQLESQCRAVSRKCRSWAGCRSHNLEAGVLSGSAGGLVGAVAVMFARSDRDLVDWIAFSPQSDGALGRFHQRRHERNRVDRPPTVVAGRDGYRIYRAG